jgi:hypothetical protein
MIREFSSRHIDWGTCAILPFIQVAKRNKSPALEQGGTLVLSHERIAQSFSSIKGRCWTLWYFGGRIASRGCGVWTRFGFAALSWEGSGRDRLLGLLRRSGSGVWQPQRRPGGERQEPRTLVVEEVAW